MNIASLLFGSTPEWERIHTMQWNAYHEAIIEGRPFNPIFKH